VASGEKRLVDASKLRLKVDRSLVETKVNANKGWHWFTGEECDRWYAHTVLAVPFIHNLVDELRLTARSGWPSVQDLNGRYRRATTLTRET
jgi:hypothetical protein